MKAWRVAIALALAFPAAAQDVQEFDLRVPSGPNDPATAETMRDLADRILPVYEDQERDRYLTNLSALQLISGSWQAADDTRQSLRERRQAANVRASGRTLLIDLYAHGKAVEAEGGLPFNKAFTQAFRELVSKLSDQDAYAVTAWVGTPLASFQEALARAFDRARSKDSVTQDEALHLMWTYLAFEAYRAFGAQLATLGEEDERRRYAIDDDIAIQVAGGKVRGRLVRPKADRKVPTLMEFTIQPSGPDAKACAAHGYAGLVVYPRGKDGFGKTVAGVRPFEHDGEDARAVIRWIARQPWSDGRVAMYGGSYASFAAWAAARRAPPELKAIATLDAMAPGIDFPTTGGIFRNGALRWALTNTEVDAELDDQTWRSALQNWYQSGKPYREIDRQPKLRSELFHRWLGHPSYDRWWQRLIPFREGFSTVNLPVLSMAGALGSAEIGSLWYFTQHQRYNKKADHTLLLGAYDDSTMLDGPSAGVHGLNVDPVARVDLRELRFQWFDHLFKGAPKPALLQAPVNYALLGANEWRQAPSLEAMANGSLKFFLDGATHKLVSAKPAKEISHEQVVDLADRGDANWSLALDLVSKGLAVRHGATFLSEPVPQPVEVSGLLRGSLDLKINKADVDLYVTLYELQAGGDYVLIADPFEFRASYARDRTERRTLKKNQRQQIPFQSEQIALRRLQAGSRLALVLGVNKRPDREINYGSGKAVRDESIADGKVPLKIQWYNTSTVEIPVRR